MIRIPDELGRGEWAPRLRAAALACSAAGAGLLALRADITEGCEGAGGQLKTAVDRAAEGWVVGYIRALFPEDAILSEEAHDDDPGAWNGADAYWTVDALDGTRSFVEGYPGFCVQAAYVQDGTPRVGVVFEPVAAASYLAAEGRGAYRVDRHGERRLRIVAGPAWPEGGRFVDSTFPGGAAGDLLRMVGGRFVECGSIGLKVCRVAEDAADVFAKELTFKLWDVGPGEVVLREAGGRLGTWNGSPIDYSGCQVHFKNILAAPAGLFSAVVQGLSGAGRTG